MELPTNPELWGVYIPKFAKFTVLVSHIPALAPIWVKFGVASKRLIPARQILPSSVYNMSPLRAKNPEIDLLQAFALRAILPIKSDQYVPTYIMDL